MGVPLLYRWLSERYPLINRPASSPPFAEVDNLYIDANGILHNATHGANKPPARNGAAAPTEADMMLAICSYLDTLVQLVRPQRLLYVAIDGVAPRAKMNQQRQRRFRVEREREQAKEAEEAEAEAKRQRLAESAASGGAAAGGAAPARGRTAPAAPADEPDEAAAAVAGGAGEAAADAGATEAAAEAAAEAAEAEAAAAEAEAAAAEAAAAEPFDSNCITPGTAFMARVTEVLSYFIRHKLQTDELWRRLRVVLSSAEAPGEGEHKIAEHIRSARELPRRHCVYGLDADLIMLGLATHAPALCILREKVVFRRASADDQRKQSLAATGEFVLLHVGLLRRYIDLEFRSSVLPFGYSLLDAS